MSQELRDKLQAALGSGYAIDRELGGGGMSRVFVAEEKSFGRYVVVKILPSDTAAGVSVDRFKREIQVVARLQHPHIVPVLTAGQLGSGADGGMPLPYYTMPFVKGESLRARLSRGGEFSINETIHVLRDVAAALAYAHREGVVHRDIKPDNVIVSGGVAVVTDFGVAKAVDVAATDEGHVRTGLTSLGIALGTPAYMSPEQASADPHVDHRSDIYSFGVLAYELLAGTSPFAGRPLSQILAAHVSETPDSVLKRRPNTPPTLASLVMRCLEKRAGDRPQNADELLTTLDTIATTPSGGMDPTAERLSAVRRRRRPLAAVLVIGIVLVSAYAIYSNRAIRPYVPGASMAIASSPDLEGDPAISPDGKLVAFTAKVGNKVRILVRQIDGGRANVLYDESKGEQGLAQWLPDGSRISFVDREAGGVFVVPVLGGTAKLVTQGAFHAWSPDGNLLAVTRGGAIWLHPMDGGEDTRLVDGQSLHSPAWSPDGRVLAYVDGNAPTLSNVSANSVWSVTIKGGKRVRVSDSTHFNVSPQWAPDGKSILYISDRNNTRDVYEQPVRGDGTPIDAPGRVTTSLGSYTMSLSRDGKRMAYDIVRNYSNIWTVNIPSVGAASMSSARPVTRENQHVESMGLSRDGAWLAYDTDRDGNANIYKVRTTGGEPVQVTSHPAPEFAPRWSPDDRQLVFHSNRTGNRDIYVVGADGGGEQQVTSGPGNDYMPDWSPDGMSVVYYRSERGRFGGSSVLISARDAQGKWGEPRELLPGAVASRVSPDGKLVSSLRNDGVIVVTPVGGGPSLSVTDLAFYGPAGWSEWGRESSTLYFQATRGSVSSIWAIAVNGGAGRRILSSDDTHDFGRQDFVTDGKRLFFTLGQFERDVSVMELKR